MKEEQKKNDKYFLFTAILVFIIIYFGVKFISNQSNINVNKRMSIAYENNLILNSYDFLEDLEYKKDIIRDSNLYSLADLDFLVGPKELKYYIKLYNDNYENYAYGRTNALKETPFLQRKLKANFNIHTVYTDGNLDIKSILDQAAEYSNALVKNFPNTPYIIAIADINSIAHCKTIIDTIKLNPNKYKNIKVVFGVEIPTVLESNEVVSQTSKVNLLALCINPFNVNMQKLFPKFGMFESYDAKEFKFDEMTEILNRDLFLSYGIAKPLQYTSYVNNKTGYLESLIKYYNISNPGFKFIESYFNPYTYSKTSEAYYITDETNLPNIYKVGSLDYYGESIFYSH